MNSTEQRDLIDSGVIKKKIKYLVSEKENCEDKLNVLNRKIKALQKCVEEHPDKSEEKTSSEKAKESNEINKAQEEIRVLSDKRLEIFSLISKNYNEEKQLLTGEKEDLSEAAKGYNLWRLKLDRNYYSEDLLDIDKKIVQLFEKIGSYKYFNSLFEDMKNVKIVPFIDFKNINEFI